MSVSAASATSGSLNVGDRWEVGVLVRSAKTLADAALTMTVTDSMGASTALTVDHPSVGAYSTIYVLPAPGRYVIVATSSLGTENFTVTALAATGVMPTNAQAIAYMAESGIGFTTAQVTDALKAEIAAQASVCKIGAVYPDDLAQALLRRVHHNLTMRGVPLGVQSTDMGSTYISAKDPEIRRLEGPYKRRTVG